jgi:TerC family integral membrane protein
MSPTQISYLVFGIVLLAAIALDLGLLSKRSANISLRKAFIQTIFWVVLALAFGVFVFFEKGRTESFEYISAYMMEWSLSIDNIFVFILIFKFFKIKQQHEARALLIGILMAIVFRIIFISAGVILVQKFEWILYIFGAFLIYTGIKIFAVKKEDDSFDPAANPVYKFLNRIFPIIHDDPGGKFFVRRNGKRFFTNMFVIVILLATTDIVFALDSIPAVFAIVASKEEMIIYTSNIFAVLGLRSLFFLLKGAVNKFEYLQQGIAVVLIFIGLKMLLEEVVSVPAYISLLVIIICLAGSIVYSVQAAKNEGENKE